MNNEAFMFFSVLSPYILVALGAGVSLISWLYFKDRANYKVTSYGALIFLISAIAFLFSWSAAYGNLPSLSLNASPAISLILATILILAIFSIISSSSRIKEPSVKAGEYYFLLLSATLGAMFMVSAKDVLTAFISLELLSMSIYSLSGITGRDAAAEASLKYFLLGSFASIFMAMGIALVYGSAGSLSYEKINQFITINGGADKILLTGILMLLIGFLFKIALMPFHFWTPDVYEGAPTQVTAFMASVVKIAGIAAMLNLFITSNDLRLTYITAFFASITMLFANMMALPQKNIKRMLAYSSVSHAGYLILGFLIFERWPVFFYLLTYSMAVFGAFTIVVLLEKKETGLEIKELNGLFSNHPVLSFAMAIFLFSLAGVPPLSGFFGKFYLFYAAIKAGWIWPVIIAVISSGISLYYYLGVIVAMFMKEGGDETQNKISVNGNFTVLVMAATTLLLGFFSQPLIDILKH